MVIDKRNMDVSGELFLVSLIVRSYCLCRDLKFSFTSPYLCTHYKQNFCWCCYNYWYACCLSVRHCCARCRCFNWWTKKDPAHSSIKNGKVFFITDFLVEQIWHYYTEDERKWYLSYIKRVWHHSRSLFILRLKKDVPYPQGLPTHRTALQLTALTQPPLASRFCFLYKQS